MESPFRDLGEFFKNFKKLRSIEYNQVTYPFEQNAVGYIMYNKKKYIVILNDL